MICHRTYVIHGNNSIRLDKLHATFVVAVVLHLFSVDEGKVEAV